MRISLAPGDAEYPHGLLELPSPPKLRVSGRLDPGRKVAIVGTRRPAPEAEAFAYALSRELSEAGIVIWSGGALGIDAAAHQGALEAGGATVAVLGHGLDQLWPLEHDALFAKIAAAGALVSQFEDEAAPRQTQFLSRNRTLVAAVELVVVVACGAKSGARNAAGAARRLGRRLAMVPHAPWERHGEGALIELQLGASPIGDAGDVLSLLGLAAGPGPRQGQLSFEVGAAQPAPRPESELLPLSERQRRVFDAIAAGARHLDTLCEKLQSPPDELQMLVLELTLGDWISESSRGLEVKTGRAQ